MNLKTFITITTAAAIGTAGIAAPAFAAPAPKAPSTQTAVVTKTSAKAATKARSHHVAKLHASKAVKGKGKI
jgi:hypothetical protein